MLNCGAIKKIDNLPCENKGKKEYKGRCGIHKNYEPPIEEIFKTPIARNPDEVSIRNTYLLDLIPKMNANVANIINEYLEDDYDMKYILRDKKTLEDNDILYNKIERFISHINLSSFDSYYLWPDNTINCIKVHRLYETFNTIYWMIFDQDVKGNYKLILAKIFLTNNFHSAKNLIIDTHFEDQFFNMSFNLDNNMSKTSFLYKKPKSTKKMYQEGIIKYYTLLVSCIKNELKLMPNLNVVFTTNIPGLSGDTYYYTV